MKTTLQPFHKNNTTMNAFLRIFVALATAMLALRSMATSNDDAATQVVNTRLFAPTLVWTGTPAPPEAESKALLDDIHIFQTQGAVQDLAPLEQFIARYPNSKWKPALEANMAEYYRLHGRYSLALQHWESAWNTVKDNNDPASKGITVKVIAGWTRLLASLGEKDKLNTLFKQIDQLQLQYGSYGTEVLETREGLGVMNGRPGVSYRCGSFALGHLADALHMNPEIARNLYEIDSPNGGFHMDELLLLAKTNGINVAAVHRPDGAALVLPCVVHWRLNHYAAILQEKGGRYLVEDPTFEGHIWMDADAINAESDGNFLLPRDKVPANWTELKSEQCSALYGKGFPNLFDDSDDDSPPNCPQGGDGEQDTDDSTCDPAASNDGSSGGGGGSGSSNCDCGGGPPPAGGMPQWQVSEPYETLWLTDVPYYYRQSDGTWMKLKLTYSSTGLAQPPWSTGVGGNWSCNWLGMLAQSATDPDITSNYLSGGGIEAFNTVLQTPDYKTARTFAWSGGKVPVLTTPAGAQNVYGCFVQVNYPATNYFLSKRLDRYGRTLQRFDYIGQTLLGGDLADVVDKDGNTNYLQAYAYTIGTYLIYQVTNSYGQVAWFNYNLPGYIPPVQYPQLNTIHDVQGLTTTFKYDNYNRITNMVTPYGTNSFQYYSGTDANGGVERALLVTEASGDHQLYVYRDDTTDSIPYPGDGYPSYRMSFHWNRAQYQVISNDWKTSTFDMPTSDYQMASIKHWLHKTIGGAAYVSDTLAASADPYDANLGTRPNCYTYSYYGQSGPYIGSLKRATSISINGQLAEAIGYNSLGRPTNYVYYSSSGAQASYTNVFDSTGQILQTEWGPLGEMTRGYGYTTGLNGLNNLLISVTNAVNDVIRYTHDPTSLKVTSITFPGGLVRTNVYYSSGPNKGFLAMQADIGYRTNYFSYTNGNLCTVTNELGLVVSYTYDSLSRLINTSYPDLTSISNIYNNLDLVATKDRLNQWTYYGYNAVRQLIGVTNVDGQVTTYSYCGCGSPDTITRFNGLTPLTTSLNYDILGRLATANYPDGYQLNYTYDANDRVQTVTDGGDDELQLNYAMDGTKSLLSEAFLGGQILLTNQFDQYGRVTNSVNRNNVTTVINYDLIDRLLNRQNFGSDGSFTGLEKFGYSALGLLNYTDQLNHVTSYGLDAKGEVLYATNGNGEVLQFRYNPAGELLTLTDGKNQTTTWNYDDFGRVTNKVDMSGTTNFVYIYDPLNRLTNRWTPAKGATVYRYDPFGNLTNVDYSRGTVSTPSVYYSYDGLNRLLSMADGIGTTTFGWTGGDQLQNETGPWANDAVSYIYADRLRSGMTLQQPNAYPWTQNYGYDSVMRLSTITSPAGSTSIASPTGMFNYTYSGGGDLVQNVAFPTFPNGNLFMTNGYDSLGRLTNTYIISPFASVADQHIYSYDLGSEVTQQVFTVGNYMNYGYDNIGQLLTALGQESSGTARLLEQFGYGYDKAWNLNDRTNNTFVQSFSVNDINELSSVGQSGTYTVAGNATEMRGSITATPPGVTNVAVNGNNASLYADGSFAAAGFSLSPGDNLFTAIGKDTYGRKSTNTVTAYLPSNPSYTYDLNGNLTSDGTRNLIYDCENELIGVWEANSWSNSFAYDGLQRRRIEQDYTWNGSAWSLTNQVVFIYDGNLVFQERDQNNLPRTTYTRGTDLSGTLQEAGGIGGLLARSDKQQVIPLIVSPGNPHPQYVITSYYHSDGGGNVTALVQPSGFPVADYNYDPFGNMIAMGGPLSAQNKYRFSSKEWNDNAGLYYYGYRFYDPNLQRWINQDPIQENGGINLYTFISNVSVNSIDAFGYDGSSPGCPVCGGDPFKNLPPLTLAQQQPPQDSTPSLPSANASSIQNLESFGKTAGQGLWDNTGLQDTTRQYAQNVKNSVINSIDPNLNLFDVTRNSNSNPSSSSSTSESVNWDINADGYPFGQSASVGLDCPLQFLHSQLNLKFSLTPKGPFDLQVKSWDVRASLTLHVPGWK